MKHEALSVLKARLSYNKYGGYCVPESSIHRPAAQKIVHGNVYEPKTIEYMRSHCGSGDIVHAGTYFGDFLPALSASCSESARIWAFEPNPENYWCAQVTCMINKLDNVNLQNAGLGKKDEILFLRTVDDNGRSLGGASRIVDDERSILHSDERVEIVTIDSVIGPDRDVSILQLDVEEHEQSALSGAIATIERCRPILILEDLARSSLLESDWFSTNILQLGYSHTGQLHANMVFQCG